MTWRNQQKSADFYISAKIQKIEQNKQTKIHIEIHCPSSVRLVNLSCVLPVSQLSSLWMTSFMYDIRHIWLAQHREQKSSPKQTPNNVMYSINPPPPQKKYSRRTQNKLIFCLMSFLQMGQFRSDSAQMPQVACPHWNTRFFCLSIQMGQLMVSSSSCSRFFRMASSSSLAAMMALFTTEIRVPSGWEDNRRFNLFF